MTAASVSLLIEVVDKAVSIDCNSNTCVEFTNAKHFPIAKVSCQRTTPKIVGTMLWIGGRFGDRGYAMDLVFLGE